MLRAQMICTAPGDISESSPFVPLAHGAAPISVASVPLQDTLRVSLRARVVFPDCAPPHIPHPTSHYYIQTPAEKLTHDVTLHIHSKFAYHRRQKNITDLL